MRKFNRLTAAAAALVLPAAMFAAANESAPSAALSTEAPAASENPISGPVLGYMFNASERKLRPIFGIPGASFIGGPLALNVELVVAEASPAGDYALGADAAGVVYRVDLRNGLASAQALTGVIAGVDRIFLSPTGSAAVVYDRQSRTVQTLSEMHGQPRIHGTIDLAGVSGVITALAVADDGRTVMAASSTREGGALYAAVSGASPERIAPAGQVLSISFLPNSTDALAADRQRHEALHITGVGRSPSAAVIASGSNGLRSPLAVAPTADGSAAIIAGSESGAILRAPLAGGAPHAIDCSCTPRGLAAMGSDSLFRLTDDPTRPVYLLDADRLGVDGKTREPRIVFVPAASDVEPAPADFGRTRRAARSR